MMKCSKCGKELVVNKKVKNRTGGTANYVADTLCMIFGGPIVTTLGLGSAGYKLWKKYVKDEMTVKCPHCKVELTLTKAEFKELKKEVDKLLDEERKSKQNRVIR